MFITIDKTIKVPMIRQIYSKIKNGILYREIPTYTKLPSSRSLAKELSISRTVVLEAYEQLHAEGYVYTVEGSGTYVSSIEHLNVLQQHPSDNQQVKLNLGYNNDLRSSNERGVIDIRTGAPDFSLFPIKKWGSIYKKVCSEIAPFKLDYYNAEGSYLLRMEILKYLNRTRGITAHVNQIFITTGATQGFNLLSRLLLSTNTRVILEDPINYDIYKMLISTGAEILSIPVDEHGMDTGMLPPDYKGELIFTTPSHQFPMGSILSIQRRLELIAFTNKSKGYIIEDDYDSAFRFSGPPVSALHTLDGNRVIYSGTFSKILFPALRIGYIIMPAALIKSFRKLKHLEDLHTPILEQITLAVFIKQGLLEKHTNRCKKKYKAKNHMLIDALKQSFGNDVKIIGDSAGIHLVAEIRNITFDKCTLANLKTMGLKVSPITPHTQFPDSYKNHIMIGYGHLTFDEIKECVKILSRLR